MPAVTMSSPRLMPELPGGAGGVDPNARFNHQGVLPGQCNTCHNGQLAKGLPTKHVMTRLSCDSCHRTVAWVPVTYTHLAPGYQPQVDKPTCVSCHITNGEIIPRQLRGGPRPKPIPVTPGQ